MNHFVILASLAAVGILVAPGAEGADGTCACPTPKTQTDFAADKYLGLWYEALAVPRDFEAGGECGTATYAWNADKSAVTVTNGNYLPSTGQVYTVSLLATPDEDAPNEGKFTVTWPSMPSVPKSIYWVLGTDYTTYAVVYSCTAPTATTTLPHVTLWVLTRDPAKFTSAVEATVKKVVTDAGLDWSILKPVQHLQGCPTASCDKQCSTAKASLDVSKLGGSWWEVQHSLYSTGSSARSCTLGRIESTADGVHFVTNTYEATADGGADTQHELNATWVDKSTKDGQFTVDASGKFCVVDTDYDNWAVISICLPGAASTVSAVANAASGGVFVLARGRGLTAAQQMKANAAVLNTGVPPTTLQATPSSPCSVTAAAADQQCNAAPGFGAAPTLVTLTSAVVAFLSFLLRAAH